MPGIAGFIRKSPYARIEQDLDVMVAALRHERRSSTGTFVDAAAGLWVGWVSHKDSYSDGMPLVARNNDVVIVFHGEHYAEPEQVDKLKRLGLGSDPGSAAYLLDLYAACGERFFSELNGWFSGVILDRRTNRVTLFNDRYAMGRIYFHETADEFVFSSEAKSLLKVRPQLRAIDEEGLADYLRYNCVLGNRTLFAGVDVLPHASAWDFVKGTPSTRRQYFAFREWEQQPELEPEDFYAQWADTVSSIFPRYVSGRRKVALSLTAGLDTRLIMAALGERNRDYAAYTFGGAWGELFDVSTARKAAAIYGQPFEAIRVNDTFLKHFGDYAARVIFMSDGAHDAFGAHDVFFNEHACDIAPVRLTGKFGSEVVRIRRLIGTYGYQQGFLNGSLASRVYARPTFQDVNPSGNHLTRVVTEEISWHEFGRVIVEQAYLTMRTPYMDNRLVKLMYQAPKGSRAAGDLQERFVKERAPEFATLITNLGRFASPSPLVTKLAYYPFWALFKMEYIYLQATPHWMTRLDRTLGNVHLERLFGGRQKWEAYRIWIKTHFADFVQDTLLNGQADYARHLERATVTKLVKQHIAGTHNHLLEINRALSVQLIYNTLLKP